MAFISLGRITIQSSYILITSAFYLLRLFIFSFFPNENYEYSLLYKIWLMGIGMMLCYIFEIISIIQQSEKTKICENFKIKVRNYCSKNIKDILILGILGIIDLTTFMVLNFLFSGGDSEKEHFLTIIRVFEIVFVCILNYLFLKRMIYCHHYASLIFIIVGLGSIMLTLNWKNLSVGYEIGFAFLADLLYATLEVTEKYLMNKKFITNHEINFFIGFYITLIMTAICIASTYVQCPEFLSISICKKGDVIFDFPNTLRRGFTSFSNFIQVFLYVILCTGYNTMIQLILKHYGPTHRVITDAFSSVITLCFLMGKVKYGYLLVIQIFGELFILLGVIVFNEIIVFHFCGLDTNTEKEIRKRALQKEELSINFQALISKEEKLGL